MSSIDPGVLFQPVHLTGKLTSRLRRDVEDNPRYFYGEREDDVESRLRRSELDADDAGSTLDHLDGE